MNTVFGKQLGQYILLEQLGEGGMAKVYNALDSRVERNVAIKVILPSKRTSAVFLQSFEREATVLANLTHTNIVKVLNYGIDKGQPYLVMEYVGGGTLKEAMDQKIPWQIAAAILAPIARALDYVHGQQIIHRDIKPSNILLQEDSTPMLSDFGILQLLESKDNKADSAIGTGVGTPEYMAPEQGMGKVVDFRADIYSLGLVFYEMVTGQKPYIADSPMAMVIKHVTDQLPLPTAIDKNIPRFVERAILRAVQKDPRKRYMSMGQFANVLEMIALGEKASPQKINRVASAREKRRLSISIIALSVLMVVLLAGTSLFAYNYFTGTRQELNATAESESLAVPVTPPQQITPTTPPTQTAAPTASPIVTDAPLANALTLLGTPIINNRPAQYQEIARWGIGGVNLVTWSPDGKTIALGTTSGIFLYDANTKQSTLFIDTQFNVLAMAFNPASGEITAGSPHGIVKAWDTQTGSENQTFTYARPSSDVLNNDNAVTTIAYSSDGEDIAVGYRNGVIDYFPSHQAASSHQLDNHPTVQDLVISSNKQFIYASTGNKEVYAWDLQFQEKTPLNNPTPVEKLILFWNEQQFLLTGGGGNSIYMWDLNDLEPKLVSSFTNMGGQVRDFDLSHDNQYVGVGLDTGVLQLYEIPDPEAYSKTAQPVQTIPAYEKQTILSVSFSPTEPVIASANHEQGLKLWDVLSGKNLFALNQSIREIKEIYFSPNGRWLATSHIDGSLQIWDVNAGKKTDYSPIEGYLPKGVPFSPDSAYLAFIYSPGRNRMDIIRILDLQTGRIVAELPDYLPKAFVQFSPDSKLLAMGTPYAASLWDVSTWERVDTHGGPTAGCGQYFTPQNRLLTMISNAGIMFTNDFNKQLQEMCGTAAPGATLVYYFHQPHQMVFVLGNETGEVWTWDFSGAELSRVGSSTPYPLPGKAFLAADQESGWYAYAERGSIVIRNINGAAGTTIAEQGDYQYRVALLPGRKLMALGSKYGSIHIWTMP
jgi:serine/threonine protein kinase/WD40 repeat protein